MFKLNQIIYLFVIATAILSFIACSDDHGHNDDHLEYEGIVLYNTSGQIIYRVFQGQIDENYQSELNINLNDLTKYYFLKFITHDNIIHSAPIFDDDFEFAWAIDDELMLELIPGISHDDWFFQLNGLSLGSTLLELQILHNKHIDFRSPKITVNIVE